MNLLTNVAASVSRWCALFAATLCMPAMVSASEDSKGNRWILFYIVVDSAGDRLRRLGEYDTMFECFDAWSQAEDQLPKQKVDFHIICVRTSVIQHEGHRFEIGYSGKPAHPAGKGR